MKKITLGLGFFFLSHSSFALTNQLRFGEKYLLNKATTPSLEIGSHSKIPCKTPEIIKLNIK